RHDMEISHDGIVVRPRTEMLLAKRSEVGQATHYRRMSTGILNLDAMLNGGLLTSSATLLLGFSGSGKTLVTQHFLDEVSKKQEWVEYLGYYEPPERWIETAEHVSLPMRQHVESGIVEIQWQPALRFGLDQLAERLLNGVRARSVRRVVIDGIDGFRQGA